DASHRASSQERLDAIRSEHLIDELEVIRLRCRTLEKDRPRRRRGIDERGLHLLDATKIGPAMDARVLRRIGLEEGGAAWALKRHERDLTKDPIEDRSSSRAPRNDSVARVVSPSRRALVEAPVVSARGRERPRRTRTHLT